MLYTVGLSLVGISNVFFLSSPYSVNQNLQKKSYRSFCYTCNQAGWVFSHCLRLLLLLVYLALQANPTCITQRLVAIGIVSPHWSFSCSTLRAFLQHPVVSVLFGRASGRACGS